MSEFWILREPNTTAAEQRRANWIRGSLKYESIRCVVNPEHRRAGTRISPLSLLLPNVEPYDFVWTHFECLVQNHVLSLLEQAKLTGFEAAKAETRFISSVQSTPKFWELVVKGSAGLASAESGYKAQGICPGCGLIDDASRITDPSKVVDLAKWDGSDFFRVEPVSGLIFVTSRVVEALSEAKCSGWQAYSLPELQSDFDVMIPISPPERSHMN